MTEGGKTYVWGTGRRKTAVARVRIAPGTGLILVNDRPFENYFSVEHERVQAKAPLNATATLEKFDIWAKIEGGGPAGQSGALSLGIARALRKAAPEVEQSLRDGGYLTRDSRMVERKKYGQKKARRRFQFSKR
ncbi:MAG: 30S ribosomal protein S9 [Planctomycetota bacterium]